MTNLSVQGKSVSPKATQNAKFYKTEGVQQAIKVLVKPQGDMGNNKESWEGILQVSQA